MARVVGLEPGHPVRGVALTRTGDVIRNVGVLVTDANDDPVTVYSDADLSEEYTDPTTDGDGVYEFYAPEGTYSIALDTTERYQPIDAVEVVGPAVVSAKFLYVQARPSMVTDGSTTGSSGSLPESTPVLSMADGSSTAAFFTVAMPADTVEGPLTAQICWLPTATLVGPSAVQWTVIAKALAEGVDAGAAGTSTTFTGSSQAFTVRVPVYEAAQEVLASVTAGTPVRVYVRRVGADAADTYTGNAGLFAVKLGYSSLG